jgi:K+-transporting ATPase ATPase C chain
MLATLPTEFLRSLRMTIVVFLGTGLVYSLAMTGVIQVLFHDQANGSLITRNGEVIGSSLIGQNFTRSDYFHGRPSATVSATTAQPQPYAADNSAGSNLGPSNQVLINRVDAAAAAFRQSNSMAPDEPVPVDIVTTDFSGFDPAISEAAALLQVHRVAGSRGLDEAKVRALVESHLHGRVIGIFGEPYVNVLEVNLALDDGAAR